MMHRDGSGTGAGLETDTFAAAAIAERVRAAGPAHCDEIEDRP